MSKSRFKILSQNKTDDLSTKTSDQLEELGQIESDWQNQMALKNEAILKSIEELLDRSLKQSSD